MRPSPLRILGALAVLAVAAQAQTVWSLAGDFSSDTNPAGTWTYGSMGNLGDALSIFTVTGSGGPVNNWSNGTFPYVVFNTDTSLYATGSVVFPARTVALHPASDGTYAVVRWTAPGTGSYVVTAVFASADIVGASTDGHVLLNGVELAGGSVTLNDVFSYSNLNLSLVQGATLDFAVGTGGNGYGYDTTALTVMIAPASIPEPATVLCIALGLVLLGGRRRQGRRAM